MYRGFILPAEALSSNPSQGTICCLSPPLSCFLSYLKPVVSIKPHKDQQKYLKKKQTDKNIWGIYQTPFSKVTYSHSNNHILMAVAATQGANQHIGAVWGSVSCPRALWHADQGNRTSDLPITKGWLCPQLRVQAHIHSTYTCIVMKRKEDLFFESPKS